MSENKINLPNVNDIEKMFKMLTGADTKVTSSTSWPVPDFKGSYLASYRDDKNNVCAFGLIDLTAGASAAAALTKIPPTRTKEVISSGQLDEILLDNLGEVLNISASLLNKDKHRHIVFKQVTPYQAMNDDFNTLLSSNFQRIDVNLQIPNYQSGKLSFFTFKE